MSDEPIDFEALKREALANAPKGYRARRQIRAPEHGEIEELLTRNIGRNSIFRTNGKEIRFWPCPVCGFGKSSRDATSINVETGLWFCFHCGKKGNTFTLMQAFGITPTEEWYLPDPDAIDIPAARRAVAEARKTRPALISSGKYPNLLAYFEGRGISAATLDAYQVVSNGASCARWPLHVRDESNEWVEVNGRVRRCLNLEDGVAKGWFEPPGAPTGLLIGQHLVSEAHGKRIWIFEGEIDMMSGYEIGLRNCVSLPNGANAVQCASLLRYIPDDWDIVLALDMDDAGKKCARLFYSQIGFERIERAQLPHKDLNAWLMKEPALTAQMVEETIPGGKAKPVAVKRLKIGGSTGEAKKNRIVCEAPWSRLSAKLGGGLLTGQTTGILAPSGIGKTTFVNQWAIHAAWKGVKAGLISVEGDRDELNHIITKAISGVTGFAEGTPGFAEIADDRLIVSALEGHSVDWRQCIDEFEAMVRMGAKLLVLDNLDFIMPRGTNNGADQKPLAYAAMIELAVRNQVHVIVVWQPNKVNRTQMVNSGNQKGLSQTFQDSDNYLNMNVSGSCRKIEIEKCRHQGIADGQHAVLLKYDGDRRCLDQVDENESDGRFLSSDPAYSNAVMSIPVKKVGGIPPGRGKTSKPIDDSPWGDGEGCFNHPRVGESVPSPDNDDPDNWH